MTLSYPAQTGIAKPAYPYALAAVGRIDAGRVERWRGGP
jgi:hypothetical protein